jgi:hypothetical protein
VFRHNPTQPTSIEENIPNGRSNLTVKEKMVHGLPIHFAHTIPINHNNVLLPEIVHGKDFLKVAEKASSTSLSPPNTLPRETKSIMTTHGPVE